MADGCWRVGGGIFRRRRCKITLVLEEELDRGYLYLPINVTKGDRSFS